LDAVSRKGKTMNEYTKGQIMHSGHLYRAVTAGRGLTIAVERYYSIKEIGKEDHGWKTVFYAQDEGAREYVSILENQGVRALVEYLEGAGAKNEDPK
jgi:hypothetical protein